jgi:fido (protein-threonine AMPylation protein)
MMRFSASSGCPDWIEIPRTEENTRDLKALYPLIIQRAPTLLVTAKEPKDWHRICFRGIVPLDYYAGNYRELNHRKPCLQVNVQVSRNENGKQVVAFAGAHFGNVKSEINDLFRWVAQETKGIEARWLEMSPPQRVEAVATFVAVLVGRFNNIHPFRNGNGRIGRLLWAWGVARYNLPVSISVATRPVPPYEHLMAQANKGDYGPLTAYIIAAIAAGP